MERRFNLDTISVSVDSLKRFLYRELRVLNNIQSEKGISGVEKYLDDVLTKGALNDRYSASPLELGADGSLRGIKISSKGNATRLDDQKALLYNTVLVHSNRYWNGEFRIQGGTKAIVADAAFGVLAWPLGPWSVVAAGCASAMVNEGEAHCTAH